MYIAGEEVFVVPYDKSAAQAMIYCPLRDYLALTSVEYASQIERGILPPELASRISMRPQINIQKLHTLLRSGAPELSLALTDNCNLACRYCHHNAGAAGKTQSMPTPLLQQVLTEFIDRLPDGEVARITFAGGGEPTYDFGLLRFAIDLAKQLASARDIKTAFRMATNGCYGKRIREYVAAQFTHVSLSFDGPRDIQDLHRPTKTGRSTFDRVYQTARLFRSAKLSFGFRATVSNLSVSRLREVVEFFATEFPGCSLGLEPLNPFGRATSDTELLPPGRQEFAEALLDLETFAQGKPITIANAAIGKFDALRTIFCGAVGMASWTVGTDGTVSCCTRDNAPREFTLGRFEPGGTPHLDPKQLDRILEMNVFNYSECQDCFCKYHCAGDCPDLRVSNLLRCEANQRLGRFWLSERVRRATEQSGVENA